MMDINQILETHDNDSCFLYADWDAPSCVKTLMTTRHGGVSQGAYASLNLGLHVGDNPDHVLENRRRVAQHIPVPVVYLNQVHGIECVEACQYLHQTPDADASYDHTGTVACAVMTADCLPVLLCDAEGNAVAAAHCGWRSLLNGVLAETVKKMAVNPTKIMAYLGAAISADAFEVKDDVRQLFIQKNPQTQNYFADIGDGQFLANLYGLAKLFLADLNIHQTFGGTHCTVLERHRFFSYRRDGQTGRMLSAIWLEK